jgi:hypothetical protein
MSLRELVTASDICTPSDGGAGPSNALGSLADTLLGRSAKQKERLSEVSGVRKDSHAGRACLGDLCFRNGQ